jgi:hypothetical protein
MASRKSTPLSGVPISNAKGGETCTISTRAIDNGFVVTETRYGEGLGDYRSSERFSKTAPSLGKMVSQPEGSVGNERLSGAIKECNS